jgi:hypothetical protein
MNPGQMTSFLQRCLTLVGLHSAVQCLTHEVRPMCQPCSNTDPDRFRDDPLDEWLNLIHWQDAQSMVEVIITRVEHSKMCWSFCKKKDVLKLKELLYLTKLVRQNSYFSCLPVSLTAMFSLHGTVVNTFFCWL